MPKTLCILNVVSPASMPVASRYLSAATPKPQAIGGIGTVYGLIGMVLQASRGGETQTNYKPY